MKRPGLVEAWVVESSPVGGTFERSGLLRILRGALTSQRIRGWRIRRHRDHATVQVGRSVPTCSARLSSRRVR